MKPRIRTIKPEAAADEELWDLGAETGLPVFQGYVMLWCQCDREGRFEWRPRALKASCLPFWDGDFSHVLDALNTRGFVVRYAIQGREFGLVRTFTRHQAINGKEPQSELPEPTEDSIIMPSSRVNYAFSTRAEHVSDVPIPSLPFRSLPISSLPRGVQGGEARGGVGPMSPTWSPPFDSFIGGGFTREVFDDALVAFRGYHIEQRTEQTEAWFRSKLSTWARNDQVQFEAGRGPRRSANRAPAPRQPESGYDFSGAVEEADS